LTIEAFARKVIEFLVLY